MKFVKLTDICNPKQWKTISTADFTENGLYDVYGANGVIGKTNEFNHEVPTLLLTCRGATCGALNITKGRCYVNGNAMCMDDLREDFILKFIYYYLKYYDMNKIISGTAQPQITIASLKKVLIPLISYEEQLKIVNELEEIENSITVNRQQVSNFDEIVKSQFIEMFGKLEDTEYPIDTLNNICEFIKDGTHQTPTYTEDEDGYIFVSSKDVTSGKIDWDNTKRIPKELHDQLYSRIAPKKNDILLSKNGTIGFAVLVEEDRIFDIYVSLAILRQNKLNSVFMKEQLNAEDCQKQFYSSLKGVGVPNLHLGEIKKTKVIVPPIELQNKFADFVQQIDKSKYFGGVMYA